MPENKCPLCSSPCIVKIIATSDDRYCEVDVCKLCGTMYPRGKSSAKPKASKAKTTAVKPRKR